MMIEVQELANRFSVACKALSLTTSIKETEIINHPPPRQKQTLSVQHLLLLFNSHTNQLDVLHKSFIRVIYGYIYAYDPCRYSHKRENW